MLNVVAVGDGVMLYNCLGSLSAADISLYNSGQVASAVLIAYLGAKRRVASKTSILHVSQIPQLVHLL